MYTFMIIPPWILLRMKNISDKSCKKMKTRMFKFFFDLKS